MAKYKKTVDIWALSKEERKSLQAGQWITAGKGGKFETKGIWCGVGKSGNDVAIWLGNLASRKGAARLEHIRFMMQYAKGQPMIIIRFFAGAFIALVLVSVFTDNAYIALICMVLGGVIVDKIFKNKGQ